VSSCPWGQISGNAGAKTAHRGSRRAPAVADLMRGADAGGEGTGAGAGDVYEFLVGG
jgi:hypothetical protein